MVSPAHQADVTCPLKINLTLSILGRRDDGFHALHSVVAQAAYGDHLQLQWHAGESGADEVHITGSDLPSSENSVVDALRALRASCRLPQGRFLATLDKRVPMGAGLGGGSSDAVGALRAARQLLPEATAGVDWSGLAASIGSDCPLFLEQGPVLMEGRGERIRPLEPELAARLSGQPIILFKPAFAVPTAEAYRRLASGGFYRAAEQAQADLDQWRKTGAQVPPAWNDFQRLMGSWMPSLAVVLDRLNRVHRLDARLSGSGSACFVFPNSRPFVRKSLEEELALAWGHSFWIQETVLN